MSFSLEFTQTHSELHCGGRDQYSKSAQFFVEDRRKTKNPVEICRKFNGVYPHQKSPESLFLQVIHKFIHIIHRFFGCLRMRG